LLLIIFFAEVHPFGSVTAEPIAVDIVTPQEVAEKAAEPELPPPPKEKAPDSHEIAPNLDLATKPQSETKASSASSPPPAAAKQQQAAAAPPPPQQKQAAAAPPTPSPATPAPPSPVSPPAQAPLPAQVMPAYVPAQPDVSVKYHVALGLPQDRPGDGFDAAATQKADVGTDSIAEFRRHLKTCSKLPQEITASDKVVIKLRVLMTPDGRLAALPALIEASASMKGPYLMQSAIAALDACQPYAMLPADRYKEWRVLDLVFTPQDFAGAS
jgi:outer membrane biosynthesis protein TonB